MTATGVALLIIGWFVSKDYPYTTDAQDTIAGLLLVIGGVLALSGVLVWLWRAMP